MSERVIKRNGANKPNGIKGFLKTVFHSGGVDVAFFCMVMIIFAFGITMMYSASYAYASQYTSGPNSYFFGQLKYAILGFIAMAIISKVDVRILNSVLTPIIFAGTMGLLVLTLVINRDKAIKRWIEIGSRQFQPSEPTKFVLVLVMSYLICIMYRTLNSDDNKRVMPKIGKLTKLEKVFFGFFDTSFKCTVLLAGVISIFCVLILLESHLSCTILLFSLGISMMWVGGVKKKWFAILGVGVVAVLVYVVFINPEIVQKLSNYGYERIMVWKTKASFGKTTYWQTEQGLLAIGSGGPFGVGFGNSKQKQLYIPEPQNDFIFSVVVEELGFVGAAIVIILFAALICRGFMIATKSRDLFSSLLVIGIMMQIGLQVILNIAVVTDTIPNTGIGLPFFSYGGTALFFVLCEMGVVLSVSRTCSIEKA